MNRSAGGRHTGGGGHECAEEDGGEGVGGVLGECFCGEGERVSVWVVIDCSIVLILRGVRIHR